VEHRAWKMSEREHRAHFEELTLLQTWGSELCYAITSPPQAKHHLSEGMQHATLRHTEMVEQFVTFQALLTSAAESMLGCSPSDTSCVELVGELVTKFQKVEGRRS
jgi:hypothetical protein